MSRQAFERCLSGQVVSEYHGGVLIEVPRATLARLVELVPVRDQIERLLPVKTEDMRERLQLLLDCRVVHIAPGLDEVAVTLRWPQAKAWVRLLRGPRQAEAYCR